MKGQISLEYLVLSLVALGLLAISLTALISIRENSMRSFSSIEFKRDAEKLAAAVNEACALGEGNYVSVELGVPVSILYSDGVMEVYSGSDSKSFEVYCHVDDSELEPGSVSVGVKGGSVEFS